MVRVEFSVRVSVRVRVRVRVGFSVRVRVRVRVAYLSDPAGFEVAVGFVLKRHVVFRVCTHEKFAWLGSGSGLGTGRVRVRIKC